MIVLLLQIRNWYKDTSTGNEINIIIGVYQEFVIIMTTWKRYKYLLLFFDFIIFSISLCNTDVL